MNAPTVPDDHYLLLGQVTAAAAMLDLQIGFVGHAAKTGQHYTENWQEVASAPGKAIRLARSALPHLDADLSAELVGLLAETEAALRERNRLAHSVLIFDPLEVGPTAPWFLRSMREETAGILHRGEDSDALALIVRFHDLAKEASALARRVAVRWRQGGAPRALGPADAAGA